MENSLIASNIQSPTEEGCPDLSGMSILLVEDSSNLGIAVKNLLVACGANVAGPVATTAEARRMAGDHAPDVALVDFHLRGGERADGLIHWLHQQGVRVVVTSGETLHPLAVGKAEAIILKPFSEAQLFAALCPLTAPALDDHNSCQSPRSSGLTVTIS